MVLDKNNKILCVGCIAAAELGIMNFRLLCICEQQSLEQEDIGRPILQVLRRLYDKISVMQMELEKFFRKTRFMDCQRHLRTATITE